jgi:hypothetical protein
VLPGADPLPFTIVQFTSNEDVRQANDVHIMLFKFFKKEKSHFKIKEAKYNISFIPYKIEKK